MAKKKGKQKKTPSTVVTLTLPEEHGIQRTGSLLIQRGDLAKLFQFHYCSAGDITSAIKDATKALVQLEISPPVIPEASGDKSAKKKPSAKTASKPADDEPTVDLPVKSGSVAVRISHLKIVSGDTDAAAYRRATLIGARLVEAGLWDGQSPIGIEDAHATYARIKDLDDEALGAMQLSDVVQIDEKINEKGAPDPLTEDGKTDDAEPSTANLPPSSDRSQQMTIF